MYRQVRVANEDADFQRLLRREDVNSSIQHYKLLTVTFGTASAPYLAVKAMQQVAHDEGDEFPLAAERIMTDYYMDDLMTGCENVDTGLKIYNEINSLLAKGGFQLQKWSSNSDDLLKIIEKDYLDNDRSETFNIKQEEIIKTLGLTWNRCVDSFQYAVKLLPLTEPVTKRKVISDICRLFDPLGWVAPCVILAKIVIQKLWIAGVGWDDVVPVNIKDEWMTYRNDLLRLTKCSVPRWMGMKKSDKKIDLHGFCDASKQAYAAVVYVRIVDSKDKIHVYLVTAKTRVAPIKTISVPRLELCGAVLLAKLIIEIAEVLKIDKTNLFAWTDSEIVLAWINNHPSRWKTFIANRVSEILSIIEPQQWGHVQSKQNPAYCASRGISPSELLQTRLWFRGTDFLYQSKVKPVKPKNISTSLEQVQVYNTVTECNNENEENEFILQNWSILTKLIRVVAYCRQFLELRKIKANRNIKKYLTALELKQALNTCIRICQNKKFKKEIHKLKLKEYITHGPIKPINPFLDDEGILRVGGRLENAEILWDRMHPIILPKSSSLTNLIIADAHYRTLHGGPQLILNFLRSSYYIIGVKQLVKAFYRKCITCIRFVAATKTQLMGQLPAIRVTPTRPFKRSGVDYAGPISLRTSKGRGNHAYKGYICLFVCMVTRAVHLEVVSDLSTQGFLAAFKRFVARRGNCSELWSDNGTNFVGASRDLQKLFKSEQSRIAKDIAEALANNGTSWHFIPPHTSNFG
ncbi:unnamed protein product [Parnassius mnemosyne]|uniref:Integrase zinc-binding domain-containing protein n=1 Tax=Parnassius mnemosyne TaxID=213953 RepID=A0AAV1M9E5_9NEOP